MGVDGRDSLATIVFVVGCVVFHSEPTPTDSRMEKGLRILCFISCSSHQLRYHV